ncbi:hypothetical protein Ahy_A05g022036 [Arachis hypogaea]|uniref:Uncharacterized protein n=1 Tax=Arachis hypogaea TaxID=3818 RepID=A0A445CZF3_ARAHY|nr:hypothetical protein Ahy_A05g022036 [Arachis hypogaea]
MKKKPDKKRKRRVSLTVISLMLQSQTEVGILPSDQSWSSEDVMDEMIHGIRKAELKKPFYSRDNNNKVRYFFNSKLFRDYAISFVANSDLLNPYQKCVLVAFMQLFLYLVTWLLIGHGHHLLPLCTLDPLLV